MFYTNLSLIYIPLSSTNHIQNTNEKTLHKNKCHFIFVYSSILHVVLQYVSYQRNIVIYF